MGVPHIGENVSASDANLCDRLLISKLKILAY